MTEKIPATAGAKALIPKAPAWLSRSEKLQFRKLMQRRIEAEKPVTASEVDLIADYVAARTRILDLRETLAREKAENSYFTVDKARLLALSKQIDATTGLAHRTASLLGLTSGKDTA